MRRINTSRAFVFSIFVALCMTIAILFIASPTTAEAASSNPQRMYRLYNSYTGEHFYTANESEKNNCALAGWTYEGIGWYAPQKSSEPVYRLYNPYVIGGDHHYTTSKSEYDSLKDKGWRQEGVGWYSEPSSESDRLAVYRQYNPYAKSGTHNFTKDKNENDSLVKAGWRAEGTGWYAVNYTDTSNLYLGSFFIDTNGGAGFETVLCTSRDGVGFEKISTPFTKDQNPYHDPAIMYKDGYFWMMSNWNSTDRDSNYPQFKGTFTPTISYSKDLKTWSNVEGGLLIEGYNGIKLESKPFGIENFDVVAPEWFVDTNGDTYIIFSAGYFGGFHGDPENDRMKVYGVKISLTADDFENSGAAHPSPKNMQLIAGTAFEIQGLDANDNYIDSSVYKEGNSYYLLTKKNGVINQIYKNTGMLKSGWKRINTDLSVGAEGPCLVKDNKSYILYTDKIDTYFGVNGMQFSIGTSLTGKFSEMRSLTCKDKNGNSIKLRHGTVIRVTGEAKNIAEAFRSSAGFTN